jgi:predicted TPR repeat methyltransferase
MSGILIVDALNFEHMGKSKKSKKTAQKYFIPSRRRKDDTEHLLKRASLAHKEGRLAEAEKDYLEVLKKKPLWGPALNALGTVFMDQGQLDKAHRAFEKATELRPPYSPAYYNLAWLKQLKDDHKGAISIYKAILKKRPDFGQAWNNLGNAYREIGDMDEALSCFRRAVKFAPDMAEAWNNLGVAQDELNMTQDAAKSYKKAIEIRSDYASAHFNLGVYLQKLRLFKEAENHYKKVLKTKPDDETTRFMLQSLGTLETPDAAPAEYVRRVFDGCARTFEKTLVEGLDYKTPGLLFDLVRPYLTEEMTVLDLGCGTGLGSQFYRPFAKKLIGVDVSLKMLEKAAEKKIYDRLEAFDILQDWKFPQKFDLIYSSDVFVYFGNLDPIIRSASSYLSYGGIIAFSVERLDNNSMGHQLFPSGRYAHSLTYIQDCLSRHGLYILEKAKADIRKESGDPVKGLLIAAKKY